MLESHRRQVTVLFGDSRGFTAFSEISEPEEVILVLREYHTALAFSSTNSRAPSNALPEMGSWLF